MSSQHVLLAPPVGGAGLELIGQRGRRIEFVLGGVEVARPQQDAVPEPASARPRATRWTNTPIRLPCTPNFDPSEPATLR